YRSRFIRRSPIAWAAAAAILLMLASGTGLMAWRAHVARHESAKAQRQLDDLSRLLKGHSLLIQLRDEVETAPGTAPAPETSVKQALDFVDQVSSEAGGNVALQNAVATSYEILGDIQAKLNSPTLGGTKGALGTYDKALQIRKTLYSANSNDLPTGLALAL